MIESGTDAANDLITYLPLPLPRPGIAEVRRIGKLIEKQIENERKSDQEACRK